MFKTLCALLHWMCSLLHSAKPSSNGYCAVCAVHVSITTVPETAKGRTAEGKASGRAGSDPASCKSTRPLTKWGGSRKVGKIREGKNTIKIYCTKNSI